MTRAVLPTPATPSYCAAMTVGTMVKRFAHVRFLVDCLWVQLLFTLSVPRDIFRTPALIWGRFIDSGNQVGRTRSDIQAAGPRRCQSQIVLLLLGCKAGLMFATGFRVCPQSSSLAESFCNFSSTWGSVSTAHAEAVAGSWPDMARVPYTLWVSDISIVPLTRIRLVLCSHLPTP